MEEKGVEVSYAIRPVAGGMPGHMNVLPGRADVAYENWWRWMMQTCPIPMLWVIGANDVVNPAAEDDPSSPIYGVPIIKFTRRNAIVMKRGMGMGYAASNSLPSVTNRMLFGNAKDSHRLKSL